MRLAILKFQEAWYHFWTTVFTELENSCSTARRYFHNEWAERHEQIWDLEYDPEDEKESDWGENAIEDTVKEVPEDNEGKRVVREEQTRNLKHHIGEALFNELEEREKNEATTKD